MGKRRKVFLVACCVLALGFVSGASAQAAITPTDAQSIIICPASLSSPAAVLRDFHINNEGITSAVVTIEDIGANYTAAENPPFDGYKNNRLKGWRSINNYNFTLAKKIISYLRDNVAHPNLKYITIMGDGLLTPPSYYYYYISGYNTYYNWVPTDFLYASPNYDFVPEYLVSRISVNSATEASTVVQKIVAWKAAADWTWFKKAYVLGGTVHTQAYLGNELNAVHALNADFFSGMDVKKCFASLGTEGKATVEPAFRDGQVGIIYHLGSGGGDYIGLGSLENHLTTADLLGYTTPVAEIPVVISTGDVNGTFDTDLLSPTFPSTRTWGEALLLSKAGGVALFGWTRVVEGDSTYTYDQGNVVFQKLNQEAAIPYFLMQAYHLGSATLGDMLYYAMVSFTQNNDMNDPVNQRVLFKISLMGDSALMIPAQQTAVEYPKAVCTAQNPDSYDESNIPVYAAPPVTIAGWTTAPSVQWTLIDFTGQSVLESNVLDEGPSPNFSRIYTEPAAARYLVRTSTPAGAASTDYTKENWLFYNMGEVGGRAHVSSIVMAIKTAGNKKYATATITVVDAAGAPVDGATVSGHWSGLASDQDSGVTAANGTVTVSSDAVVKNLSGTFTFYVTDITKSGWTYTSSDNVISADSITA